MISGPGGLYELRQHSGQIAGVSERDRGPQGAVPWPLVDQLNTVPCKRIQHGCHVVDRVADMVEPLTAASQEPAYRRVGAERLEQLDVRAGRTGRIGQRAGRAESRDDVVEREHRLANALLGVRLDGDDLEAEARPVAGDGHVEVVHRDPDVVDPPQHGLSMALPYGDGMAVIVSGARTPIGKLLGGLGELSAMQLGGHAIAAALERGGVGPTDVDYVIMGQVLQAGAGQIPARQAAVAAGIPMTVPALTINKVCLSGLDAIALADQLIRAGEFDVVVAGGMESMTNAPHLLPGARRGVRYGSAQLLDATAYDGLTDPFDHLAMGESTERHNAKLDIGRADQDALAAQSHQRAARARESGLFAEEIVPVPVPQRRGEPVVVADDEGIRPETTVESLAKLKPAFDPDGTITAGSASQISDGACAVVVTSERTAEQRGWPVLAQIGAHGVVAGPDNSLHSQPARAIDRALRREGLSASDLDLVEINEAFAAVVLQSMRELGLDDERVNVNGGAIALGHPIGMSGARLVLHLAYELRRRGGGIGAAGLCGGGGQGDALVLRVAGA